MVRRKLATSARKVHYMFVLGDGNPLVHIRAPYVNRTIIILCCATFIAQAFGQAPSMDYGLIPAGFGVGGPVPGWIDLSNTPQRLFTYQFMHGDLAHLFGNMLMLWVFGDNIEDALGHLKYLLFYLLCGIVSAVVFAVFASEPLVPLIGASGSISGVMGAYLLLHPRARVLVAVFTRLPLVLPAGLVVGFYLAINLMMAVSGTEGAEENPIAWWGHVGGFAAGLALISPMRRRGVKLFQPMSAYPVDPFPRLRSFAAKFGLGGLFAGSHPDSPDNDWLAVVLRAVIFLLMAGMFFGFV